MRQINIGGNESGQRMDKMLAKYLRKAPKSFIYKMLRKKNITLNNKKAAGNEVLKKGDEIRLFLSEETVTKFLGPEPGTAVRVMQAMETRKDSGRTRKDGGMAKDRLAKGLQSPPEILYEDSHIVLFDKPVGMLSQKAQKGDVSLVEYLISHLLATKALKEEELALFRPSVCNRLDRNTSGLVAAGKSLAGLQELSRLFKERSLGKYYLCLVYGRVDQPSHIKGFLKKDGLSNKVVVTKEQTEGSTPIETSYVPLCGGAEASLLRVHLLTGKTHQIRAHLASIGHPIAGDAKYGSESVNRLYRRQYGLKHQLLHAYLLTFPEMSGALANLSRKEFLAPLPEEFKKIALDKGVLKNGYMELTGTSGLHFGGSDQPHQ